MLVGDISRIETWSLLLDSVNSVAAAARGFPFCSFRFCHSGDF